MSEILLKYLVRGGPENPDEKRLKYLVRVNIWSGRAKNNTDRIFRDTPLNYYYKHRLYGIFDLIEVHCTLFSKS